MSNVQLPALLNDNLFETLQKRAMSLSKSTAIPSALRGKPEDITVILLMAHELDIPPMQAINGIDVIQGVPTISPQLMIALIRRKIPGAVIVIMDNGSNCECFMARSDSDKDRAEGYMAKWDMNRVAKLGLATKDNYQKQPNTMLMWRAVGEAARKIFPDILSGLYFPDEISHIGNIDGADENGEVVTKIDDNHALVTKDDCRAMSALMRDMGWTSGQIKNVCMEKFKIGDAGALNKEQYKEIIGFMRTEDPKEVAG